MAKKGRRKIATVMREFAKGKLRSSSGSVVISKKQALAIAHAEAGLARARARKKKKRSK
ncbi:MAG: hypothetical protein ACE5HA_08770 [Anaerolineae bacterium]